MQPLRFSAFKSFLLKKVTKIFFWGTMAAAHAGAAAQTDSLGYGYSSRVAPFRWATNVPPNCPLAPSKALTGIEFTGRYKNYTNADTWYPTWGSDDVLYSPWTDGYLLNLQKFEPFNDAHPGLACNSLDFMGRRAATGQAAVLGADPMNLEVVPLGRQEASPLPYGGRYPCGSLMHNGVWYYGTYCLTNHPTNPCGGNGWTEMGPFVGFRTSTDLGKTWTEPPHTPEKPLFGENPQRAKVKLGAPHFVDFGKNLAHSPDGYAYLVAHGATDPASCNNWIQGDEVYLIRVKPSVENLNNPAAYEFYAGPDRAGKPRWSRDFGQIKPILAWKDGLGSVTVTYNAPLRKYLMCVTRGVAVARDPAGLVTDLRYDTMILEAASLTGQWRLVQYLDRFGPVAYFVNLPSKFISADGRTLWLCYSANWHDKNMYSTPAGSHYAMSLHEIRLLGKGK
jgi:hypothetical protein